MTRNSDGSITYKDASGNSVTVDRSDSENITKLEGILGQQQDADRQNKAALSLYAVELASSQKQIDLGGTMPDIPIPMLVSVDDQGNTSSTPATGLPVLKRVVADHTKDSKPFVSGAQALDDEAHQVFLMTKYRFQKDYPNVPLPLNG